MQNFLNWLTASSVNPNAWSLAIKGLGVAILPVVLVLAPIIGIDPAAVSPVFDAFVHFVEAAAATVSAFMVVVGLARKARVGQWSAVDQ